MYLRLTSAVATGSIVTLGLFYIMQALVSIEMTVDDIPRVAPIKWIRDAFEEEPPTTADPPPQINDVEQPPVQPRRIDDPGFEQGVGVHLRALSQPAINDVRPEFGFAEGAMLPIVRVSPNYPPAAVAREIEGYVLVVFDILADGTVANVRVADASHKIFERAAINAAYKFRYKPRVIDGVPLMTSGVQNLFRFRLED